jgi:putative spermidine/putrescine transport system substrate-binding protein
VNQSGDDITKKCLADTGIKIEYRRHDRRRDQARHHPAELVRRLDTEYFAEEAGAVGQHPAIDAKKIKEFDNITPVFTKGQLPNGKKIGDQGTAPKKVMFLEGANSKNSRRRRPNS